MSLLAPLGSPLPGIQDSTVGKKYERLLSFLLPRLIKERSENLEQLSTAVFKVSWSQGHFGELNKSYGLSSSL